MKSRLARLPLFVLLLTLALPALLQAQSTGGAGAPLVLTDDQDTTRLGRHMEILADPSGKLTIDDVTRPEQRARFTPSTQDNPDLGRSTGAYWARVPVHNASSEPLWIVAFDVYQQDTVDYYLQDASGKIVESVHTGMDLPYSTRDIPGPAYAFHASILPGEDATIYLRTAGEQAIRFPVTLQSVASFVATNDVRLLLSASLYGFLLLMAVYNVLIAISLRDRDHALLAAFIVALTVTLAIRDGRAHQFLWPQHPEASHVLLPLSIGLTEIFLVLFTASFLQTRKLLPRIHKILLVILVLVAAATALVPAIALGWMSQRLVDTILLCLAIPLLLVVALAGPLALYRGNRQARYFVVALFVPFIAGMGDVLSVLGVIPFSGLLASIPLGGDVLLVLFFSLALADRVHALNQQVEKHRDHLEELVAERTQDLLEANQLLEEKQRVADTLREAAILLSGDDTQSAILDEILRLLAQVVPYDGASIYLDDGGGAGAGDIVSVGAGGQAEANLGRRIPLASHYAEARVYNEARAFILDTVAATEATPPVDRDVCCWIGLPLVTGGKAFGVLSIENCEPSGCAASDLGILEAFASQAATVVMNHRLYARAQAAAASQERERLARDLHDAVTQTLFSTSLIAEALPAQITDDLPEAMRNLDKLGQLTRGALAEMRTLLMELRPAALLAARIDQLIDTLVQATAARSRITFSYTVHGASHSQLPADVQIAVYRIVQESLNNVLKHSGASKCLVDLWQDEDGVEVIVSDNGRGFELGEVSPEHLGLGFMRERADGIGAELTVESGPDEGAHIRLCWRGLTKGGRP